MHHRSLWKAKSAGSRKNHHSLAIEEIPGRKVFLSLKKMQNLLVQAKIMSNRFLIRNPFLFLAKNAKSAGPSENHHWIAKYSFLGIHPFQRFIVCEMLEFWKDLLVNERMKAFYCKADELDHVWFDLREEVIISDPLFDLINWLTWWLLLGRETKFCQDAKIYFVILALGKDQNVFLKV